MNRMGDAVALAIGDYLAWQCAEILVSFAIITLHSGLRVAFDNVFAAEDSRWQHVPHMLTRRLD